VKQFIDGGLTQTALGAISGFKLWQLLKELYQDAGVVYGAKVAATIKKNKARMTMGFSENMQRLLEQYFRYELLNTVEDITQTTREKIQEILTQASINGSSIDDIIKQLTALEFTKNRAKLIARTETVTAANQGAVFAAQSSGATRKVWIAARDSRTRRSPRDAFDHLHMDGVEVMLNDNFVVSGQLMGQPGDRKQGASAGNICNCRCTVGFK